MGHSDLTDGTWVWPQGLVHYVEEHGLALPEQFVGHVLAHQGVVPPLPAEIARMEHAQKTSSVDPTFWNDWFTEVADGAG